MKAHPDINDTLRNHGASEARARHDRAKKYNGHAGDDVAIAATPFAWCDPTKIPPRRWLYGKHYVRQYISCTIAPSGLGKTSLSISEILSMASGKPLLGVAVPERLRVWDWNGEDPADEITRRIMAAALHHGLTKEDLEGYLFADTGRNTPIVFAKQERYGVTIAMPVVDALIAAIKQRKIDLMVVDPFVKSHRVSENDNLLIDIVATHWAQIADATGCCIELLHHPRKTPGEVTVDDGRGASALVSASRSARVLNWMSEDEASKAGIEPEKRWRYFRAEDGKQSMAPRADNADWYTIVNVELGNGDHVGVVDKWAWPDPLDGISTHDLRAAQKAVSEGGPWRANHQAKAWVGKPIAEALKLNIKRTTERRKVMGLLKTWLEKEMFVVVEAMGPDRHPTQYVEVGKWADD